MIDLPISLRLKGPGGKIAIDRTVSLAAGERKLIRLNLPIKDPGVYQGLATLDRDDPLMWDNERSIALETRYPDRLLLIDGDAGRRSWENETYFVERHCVFKRPSAKDRPAPSRWSDWFGTEARDSQTLPAFA